MSSDRLTTIGAFHRHTPDSPQSSTSQVIGATRQYDALGNLDSSTGTWKGPFGYGGAFGYQETGDHGLKLLGHRYYDSSTGRFLSRDPAKDGRNWYGYCQNNPQGSADPSGLFQWPWPANGGLHNSLEPGSDRVIIALYEYSDVWYWGIVPPGMGGHEQTDIDYAIVIGPGGSVEQSYKIRNTGEVWIGSDPGGNLSITGNWPWAYKTISISDIPNYPSLGAIQGPGGLPRRDLPVPHIAPQPVYPPYFDPDASCGQPRRLGSNPIWT